MHREHRVLRWYGYYRRRRHRAWWWSCRDRHLADRLRLPTGWLRVGFDREQRKHHRFGNRFYQRLQRRCLSGHGTYQQRQHAALLGRRKHYRSRQDLDGNSHPLGGSNHHSWRSDCRCRFRKNQLRRLPRWCFWLCWWPNGVQRLGRNHLVQVEQHRCRRNHDQRSQHRKHPATLGWQRWNHFHQHQRWWRTNQGPDHC